jgi:hypothetical protein
MAFRLILEFQGLCLFVPDEQKEVMHVLMPASGSHMPHDPFIYFDPRHDQGGNPIRASEPLTGLRWSLSNIVSGGADLNLPPQVLDVAACVGKAGIDRAQVTPGMQTGVGAHLVLTAGKVLCRGPAPKFNIGNRANIPAASMLRWVIDVPDKNVLEWAFEDIDGSAVPAPVPLVPIGNDIRLFVHHTPRGGGVPVNVCIPTTNHAPMYYPLLNGTGAMPICRGTDQFEAGTCLDAPGIGMVSPEGSPVDPALPDGLSDDVADEARRARHAWRASGARDRAPNVFTCMLGQTKIA